MLICCSVTEAVISSSWWKRSLGLSLHQRIKPFLQAVHQLSRGAACRHTPCLREQTLYSLLLGDKSSILGLAKTGSITRGLGESSRVVINHSHGDVFRQGSAEGEGVKPAAEHVSSRRWQTKTLCHGTIEESGKLRLRSQWDGNSVPSTGWFPIPSPCGLCFIPFLFFFKRLHSSTTITSCSFIRRRQISQAEMV